MGVVQHGGYRSVPAGVTAPLQRPRARKPRKNRRAPSFSAELRRLKRALDTRSGRPIDVETVRRIEARLDRLLETEAERERRSS